ncbi:hypothetical protein ATDW_26630 [Asticcacaulis sp. DW145]|uniref:Uncharacterized protein n=1 Tax=Asticcacaulis currens TaxID=2984210 RepID=A0ABT5IFF6_9CAUL|nr:hypothetical protein [Asticcacaulis currens]MDC7694927.1 hypothetical protein [Asticcacaulis currens]BEV12167.1 hypothetical protein ATDW_26630 [Asticcacaulis sp. DW145]
MKIYLWVAGVSFVLLTPIAHAKEKLEWRYDRANEGVLVLYDVDSGSYPYEELSLTCEDNGDLSVEARGIRLWSDVNGPVIDPEDLQSLAIETDMFRIEAPLQKVTSEYSGWAQARFPKSGSLVEGLMGTFLVVRAVNRNPVLSRPLERGDYSRLYPAPDYMKSGPFRQYCAKRIVPLAKH